MIIHFVPFGRINRATYLGVLVAALVLSIFANRLGIGGGIIGWLSVYIWGVASVKRLHDIGRSGVWLLLLLAPPVAAVSYLSLAFFTATTSSAPDDAVYRSIGFGGLLLVWIASVLGYALFTLCLLIWPRQIANNRFDKVPHRLAILVS